MRKRTIILCLTMLALSVLACNLVSAPDSTGVTTASAAPTSLPIVTRPTAAVAHGVLIRPSPPPARAF